MERAKKSAVEDHKSQKEKEKKAGREITITTGVPLYIKKAGCSM